uniref:NADH-ubiquinone oxidoreductase chain 2 n=1 Tax=Olophrum piceum TaxID=347416 RepID=A0A0S2M7Y9_9COLE|nr:NADH dehydrogenase subunit 2 [Olophrum piceum]ALO70794.1 NADH deshydrogenase subunit 2 [Olophrum piceum]
MMFMSTLMVGTLISISSYSWMGMWLGLEINLLSIIPLMNNSKNLFSSESSLKYFITQTLASTILLFSIIFMSQNFNFNLNINNPLLLMFNSALLTKMGAAPFHFWFPEVMDGLNWINCLIMLTWQKMAPMIMLMYNMKMTVFFSIIIIFSMLISGLLGLNQTSLRKILAYSSINHIGWMLACMFFMETVWTYYFITYTIISINIILIFKLLSIFYMKQLFTSLNNSVLIKMFFIFNFMSLGGLPPFLGFMPKWFTIQMLASNSMYLLTILMVMMTLLTLFYYMRITFSTLILNMSEINFYKNQAKNPFLIFFMNCLSILGLFFCTLTFNIL